MRFLLSLSLYLGVLLLSGCETAPSSQAVADLARMLKPQASGVAQGKKLDPRFQYLRMVQDKREIFLALGYLDPRPGDAVEVWYSGVGEVLKLQNGRVVGAVGAETEWLQVAFHGLPAWPDVVGVATYQRVRDVSPGYRYGVHEQLTLRRISAPGHSNLQGVVPESLVWFDETRTDGKGLPPSRYALRITGDKARVLYGEHCLAVDLCFTWQRWSSAGAQL